ncbi:hypothetical protein [Nocardia brasiliensis]|uniref:hypothetical protein n=1 Tax=Nocardia brasiliensis TaxID=37326 RepID=UPI002453AC3B|nr:hypothetical protein [Nocardia brasiliensis]
MTEANKKLRVRYTVDWSDSSYPKIVRMADDDEDRYGNAQTFMEAKAEIREYFSSLIEYARGQLKTLSQLRASDIQEDCA